LSRPEHVITNMNKTIASTLIVGSLAFGAGQMADGQDFDCKDTNCQVQVFVEEPNFKDAIYYKPDVWNEKTAEDLVLERKDRYDKWKAFVDEQSKKETNEETE
jgi:hypothetical protein